MRSYYIWLGLVVLLGMLALPTVSTAYAPIVLRRADELRTEQSPTGPIRYLDGNVWITHDTLSVTCEHAIYEENLGRLIFQVKVHFVDPSKKMWADQATYYEQDGRAIAEGRVRIEQDSLLITCHRVVYQEARSEAIFFGDVRIKSLKENAVLTGNQGAYSRKEDRGVMSQNPCLVRYFEATDSMVVIGNLIEYYFGTQAATVNGDVVVRRGDFQAWGDTLYYQRDGDWARLLGNPSIQRGSDHLSADTVDTYFADQKIKRARLAGNALATSPADSLTSEPLNRMTGREMEISFQNGELDSIRVVGNATSIYYVREEQDKKGANRVSGDKIDIWVEGRRIQWIYVEGGTEGIYFPAHLERQVEEAVIVPPPARRFP